MVSSVRVFQTLAIHTVCCIQISTGLCGSSGELSALCKVCCPQPAYLNIPYNANYSWWKILECKVLMKLVEKPSQLCHLCNTLLTSNVYEEFIHGN